MESLPSRVERQIGPDLENYRVYWIGPELSLPLATKKSLHGFLNDCYSM